MDFLRATTHSPSRHPGRAHHHAGIAWNIPCGGGPRDRWDVRCGQTPWSNSNAATPSRLDPHAGLLHRGPGAGTCSGRANRLEGYESCLQIWPAAVNDGAVRDESLLRINISMSSIASATTPPTSGSLASPQGAASHGHAHSGRHSTRAEMPSAAPTSSHSREGRPVSSQVPVVGLSSPVAPTARVFPLGFCLARNAVDVPPTDFSAPISVPVHAAAANPTHYLR